jgi:acyl-ACP thioesterase
VATPPAVYERTVPITSTEVDRYGNCRPAALLSFFQDVGGEHSTLLGIHREYLLAQYGAVWMLVRVSFQLKRPLHMGEALTLRTWHRGAGSLIVYRDFDLLVGEEPVGEAVSAWVVADLATRKMLRPSTIAAIVDSPVPDRVHPQELRLIKTQKDALPVYQKTIRFSDLDLNGHMNNTKYADVIQDAFTGEEVAGKFLSAMQLNYSQECLEGETLDIRRKAMEGSCYIDGCGPDGSRRFEAILQFERDFSNPLDENLQ